MLQKLGGLQKCRLSAEPKGTDITRGRILLCPEAKRESSLSGQGYCYTITTTYHGWTSRTTRLGADDHGRAPNSRTEVLKLTLGSHVSSGIFSLSCPSSLLTFQDTWSHTVSWRHDVDPRASTSCLGATPSLHGRKYNLHGISLYQCLPHFLISEPISYLLYSTRDPLSNNASFFSSIV